MQGRSFVSSSGKRLVNMDGNTIGFRIDEDVETMRGDLGQILYEQTKDSVEYIFDDSITSLVEEAAGIRVTIQA